MGVLYYSLSIQCVSVGLVTVGSIHFLFHSQTVTGSKGYFLAGFNGSGSGRSTASQSAAGSGLEAAVVDGVGNVTRCGQFACVGCGRRSHFAVIGYGQRSSRYSCFQLILSRTASAGNVGRIPSFVGQSGYSTGIAVNRHWIAAGSGAYGNAVGQLEADFVVFNGGNNVAVTCVFNGFGQFNGVRCAVVGSNLEAVFFQVVQLAAVDGFFAACGNGAVRYVTQSHRAACSTAYQVHFVARCSSRIACSIGIGHRSIELHGGHTACGADVGYGALTVGEVDGVAVSHEVFVCAVTLYSKACVQYVFNGGGVVAFVVGSQCSTIVVGRISGGSSGISQVALHIGQGGR